MNRREVDIGRCQVGNNKIIMKQVRGKKGNGQVRLPLIREKQAVNLQLPGQKAIRLERITPKKNLLLGLADFAKISKIEKEFAQMTQRKQPSEESRESTKDEMRESRLLLFKNISPSQSKKVNQNLLSNLVSYVKPRNSSKPKVPSIAMTNLSTSPNSLSPSKFKKSIPQSYPPISILQPEQLHETPLCRYANSRDLLRIDFVKLFIVEELLYYISKQKDRSKEELTGFCKFYNENTDQTTPFTIASVLNRQKQYLAAVFYEKLGFYIFLILATDTQLQTQSMHLLSSLTDYLHTNNLILLDILMEIIELEQYAVATQFHVYNTSRFNEDRRKIRHQGTDRMSLVIKNTDAIIQIIKGLLITCTFESLRAFVLEIMANQDATLEDKIKEVTVMLVSLDSILASSLEKTQSPKPKPPFLPPKEKNTPYTLVLDMDETLIHYVENDTTSTFLVRPYCHEFLAELSPHFQLIIFTAAVKEYADSILDILDKRNLISHRLYREHTRMEDYVSVKDLSLINRDLEKTIIIDNIASNFKCQPRNGIAIATWVGDSEDISLLNLIPVLKKLVTEQVKDVREALEVLSQYMEAKVFRGEEINFDKISLKGH